MYCQVEISGELFGRLGWLGCGGFRGMSLLGLRPVIVRGAVPRPTEQVLLSPQQPPQRLVLLFLQLLCCLILLHCLPPSAHPTGIRCAVCRCPPSCSSTLARSQAGPPS